MMGRRRKSPVEVVLIVALMSTVTQCSGLSAAEPSLDGRPLSEWLMIYVQRVWGNKQQRAQNEGYIAVRRIGTNALPCLLEWIHQEYPDRSALVRAGFDILREEAAPAIPELSRILNEDSPDGVLASNALGRIGKQALPVLQAALDNPLCPRRRQVAFELGEMRYLGTNLLQCIPSLARCCLDRDLGLVMAAATALGNLCLLPDVSVPALTNALERSDSVLVTEAVMRALANFGASARAAVPALMCKYKDSSGVLLQVKAQEALLRIAPEVVTNYIYPFRN
jgi:hypothetical protein